jgi:GNAT superfamily N-acetyltransferase
VNKDEIDAPGGLTLMIRRCNEADLELIWGIINDGAQAYKGTIPADRCEDPYMSQVKLRDEIADGVVFWGYEENSQLVGVMGIQHVQDVTLIRHAYVRTTNQNRGIGAKLLSYLRTLSTWPMLIGTWADAFWAVRFYESHGFSVVEPQEKERLLRTYWKVPERQIETSVVLVDERWRKSQSTDA